MRVHGNIFEIINDASTTPQTLVAIKKELTKTLRVAGASVIGNPRIHVCVMFTIYIDKMLIDTVHCNR